MGRRRAAARRDYRPAASRLDQALGARVTLFGRYNDSPSRNEFGALAVNQLDLRSQSLTLGLNARATPNLIFDSPRQ